MRKYCRSSQIVGVNVNELAAQLQGEGAKGLTESWQELMVEIGFTGVQAGQLDT